MDTPGDFFRRSRRCGSFVNSCDKIAQPDGLALLAIRSKKRRKSRERADLANASEFNRRYLTCQISAILYADRGDRRKSQSLHRAHLAIFADRGDRGIKSPSVEVRAYCSNCLKRRCMVFARAGNRDKKSAVFETDDASKSFTIHYLL